MVHIDLLNPQTAETFAGIQSEEKTKSSGGDRVWPVIVGINALILIVIVVVIMLIPANALPSALGDFVRQAQKAFTRLFNMIM